MRSLEKGHVFGQYELPLYYSRELTVLRSDEAVVSLADTYELADYSVGDQVLKFPYEELGELIKPRYVCRSEERSE